MISHLFELDQDYQIHMNTQAYHLYSRVRVRTQTFQSYVGEGSYIYATNNPIWCGGGESECKCELNGLDPCSWRIGWASKLYRIHFNMYMMVYT